DRDAEKAFHVVHKRTVTASELLGIGTQASDISTELLTLTSRLLVLSHREDELSDLLRKLLGKTVTVFPVNNHLPYTVTENRANVGMSRSSCLIHLAASSA